MLLPGQDAVIDLVRRHATPGARVVVIDDAQTAGHPPYLCNTGM